MIAANAVNSNLFQSVWGWNFFAFYYGKCRGSDLG